MVIRRIIVDMSISVVRLQGKTKRKIRKGKEAGEEMMKKRKFLLSLVFLLYSFFFLPFPPLLCSLFPLHLLLSFVPLSSFPSSSSLIRLIFSPLFYFSLFFFLYFLFILPFLILLLLTLILLLPLLLFVLPLSLPISNASSSDTC